MIIFNIFKEIKERCISKIQSGRVDPNRMHRSETLKIKISMDRLNNSIDRAQRIIGEMEEKSEETQDKETKT